MRSATEIRKMMAAHRVTVRDVAVAMDVTQVRVRIVLRDGLVRDKRGRPIADENVVHYARDWREGIRAACAARYAPID